MFLKLHKLFRFLSFIVFGFFHEFLILTRGRVQLWLILLSTIFLLGELSLIFFDPSFHDLKVIQVNYVLFLNKKIFTCIYSHKAWSYAPFLKSFCMTPILFFSYSHYCVLDLAILLIFSFYKVLEYRLFSSSLPLASELLNLFCQF